MSSDTESSAGQPGLLEYPSAAVVIRRVGLSLVFIFFGISQLADPEMFLGYWPPWIPITDDAVLVLLTRLHGASEVLFGVLLGVGFFTRISAAFLGLQMVPILISSWHEPMTLARDFGIMVATLSIALSHEDSISVDHLRASRR